MILVAAAVAGSWVAFGRSAPSRPARIVVRRYTVVAPARVGAFRQAPAIAGQLKIARLRTSIVARSAGEARHVVDAVYADSSGPGGRSAPQFILFIGGNLVGTSASSFVDSFIGKLPGAAAVRPGRPGPGAEAACAPGRGGGLAECAWADGDTFGVLASPTLGAAALGHQLRLMRPSTERPVR